MPKKKYDGVKKRCDCAIRRWPTCPHPWHFSFHHGGREWRYSLDVIARARGQQPPATKAEALTWRETLRTEIRRGVDPLPPPATTPAPPTDTRLTFGDVVDDYLKRHVGAPMRRDAAQDTMKWTLGVIRRTQIPAANGAVVRFESKPIADITAADIEALRDARRAALAATQRTLDEAVALEARAALPETSRQDRRGLRRQARSLRRSARCRPGTKSGEVGINRLLARVRHVFTWAIKKKGCLDAHPFKRAGEVVVELETGAETARTRRLEVGEEERMLQAAGPHLRALIAAALSTGCRLGELLSLQWKQVRRDDQGCARWLVLPAGKTKTNEPRLIPVGPRLRAELEMRRTDVAGHEFGPDAYVFGNEVGEQIGSIKTAWRATCRRAGITGLHFHDLRREFGSRLLESGASQHDVKDFLGHANITTTSRYLKSTPLRLEKALERMERGLERDIRTLSNEADKPVEANQVN
jgi:integrase